MTNWKYFLFKVFVLVSIKVSNIRSGCSWDAASNTSQKYCSITCDSKNYFSPEHIEKVMPALNQEWEKRSDCHNNGIDLKLKNLKYSEVIFKPNYFTAQVKVRDLSVDLKHDINLAWLKMVEIDAFNVEALKFLKKLKVDNICFTPIKKGIFNGLKSLEVLNIKGTQLKVIQAGLLDDMNDTLKEFSLEESALLAGSAIIITGLTGSKAMEKLENVKFRYDLNTSIERNTLVGIPNVKTLDLSECKIQTIQAGAFDSLNFLEILKLKDNYLTLIPDGFFKIILLRNKTQIFLEGNRFRCDCDLMPFKMSLIEYSNFVSPVTCYSEQKYQGHPIIEIEFCDIATSTTNFMSTSTSSPSQVCIASDKSYNSEVVFINSPAQKIQIFETENEDVVLRVDEPQKKSVLIWFSLYDRMSNLNNAKVDVNCLIGSATSFRIDNLTKDSVYTFCLMDAMKETLSPLDCISYIKKSDFKELPWLFNKNKTRIIGIALLACGLNTLLGFATGIFKAKFWKRYQQEPFIRSYQSSLASSMRRSRMSMMTSDSFMTRRTTNTTVQFYLNGNYDAPPLPARPVSMYLMDEPVYATIRDFASIIAPSQTNDQL